MVIFENEKATIAYGNYVTCLNAVNTPSDIQEPLLIGFVEALYQLNLITELEYTTLANLWYPE